MKRVPCNAAAPGRNEPPGVTCASRLPRVVAVGFNKCGTRAFAELFRKAGHPAVHHKVRDRFLIPRRIGMVMRKNLSEGRKVFDSVDGYTFYCDLIISDGKDVWDGATAFREILRDYPDSILILNLRDREAWIRSRMRHGHGEFAKREMAARGLSRVEDLTGQWRAEWDQHVAAVRHFMRDRPEQFLEYNLDTDTPDMLVSRLSAYRLNAADFQDVGRTRGEQMSALRRWVKTLVAHARPRFFR